MKIIPIKKLEKYTKEEQVLIKKEIIKTNALESIPTPFLPNATSTEYYFISYSHLDYKKVYCDLFDLEDKDLPLWYDRGIPAGTNWKDIASKYIATINCKGTIFYISKNSLKSQAVVEEIKYACDFNKPFLVIYIPSHKNETLFELIKRLYVSSEINEENYLFFNHYFSKEVIYLSIDTPSETKAEKIKNSFPKQSLLHMGEFKVKNVRVVKTPTLKAVVDGYNVTINRINDIWVTKIDLGHFLQFLDNKEIIDFSKKELQRRLNNPNIDVVVECETRFGYIKELRISTNTAVFANMPCLESVEIPVISTVHLDKYAFVNCKRLKCVNAIRKKDSKENLVLGKSAFLGCSSLESFDFDYTKLSEECFRDCESLLEADLSNVVMGKSDLYSYIPARCFDGCKSLKKVILPHENLKKIEEFAFCECESLEEITIPPSVKKIEGGAFYSCKNLKHINYDGPAIRLLRTIDFNTFTPCNFLFGVIPSGITENGITVSCKDKTFLITRKVVEYIEGDVDTIVIGEKSEDVVEEEMISHFLFTAFEKILVAYDPNKNSYFLPYISTSVDISKEELLKKAYQEFEADAVPFCCFLRIVEYSDNKKIIHNYYNCYNGFVVGGYRLGKLNEKGLKTLLMPKKDFKDEVSTYNKIKETDPEKSSLYEKEYRAYLELLL